MIRVSVRIFCCKQWINSNLISLYLTKCKFPGRMVPGLYNSAIWYCTKDKSSFCSSTLTSLECGFIFSQFSSWQQYGCHNPRRHIAIIDSDIEKKYFVKENLFLVQGNFSRSLPAYFFSYFIGQDRVNGYMKSTLNKERN